MVSDSAPTTGEPLDWAPSPGDVTIYEWTRRWAAEQWDEWQPRSRASALEALSRFVPLVARELAPDPPLGLRQYVARALDPSFVSAGVDPHAAWLARWSRPLAELTRENLAGVELALSRQLDGTPLSPSTAARYRKVSRACVRRAVDLEVLPADPWPPVSRGRGQRKAARASAGRSMFDSCRTRRSCAVRLTPSPPISQGAARIR